MRAGTVNPLPPTPSRRSTSLRDVSRSPVSKPLVFVTGHNPSRCRCPPTWSSHSATWTRKSKAIQGETLSRPTALRAVRIALSAKRRQAEFLCSLTSRNASRWATSKRPASSTSLAALYIPSMPAPARSTSTSNRVAGRFSSRHSTAMSAVMVRFVSSRLSATRKGSQSFKLNASLRARNSITSVSKHRVNATAPLSARPSTCSKAPARSRPCVLVQSTSTP